MTDIELEEQKELIEEPVWTDIYENLENKILIDECPFCGSKKFIVIKKYDINRLVNEWKEKYKLQPISPVYFDNILEKRECANCNMQFYNYRLPDSSRLYEELSKISWYYPENRWDYDAAAKMLVKYESKSLLEIGCGRGYFLDKVKNLVPYIVGNEFNQDAREFCKGKGLNVINNNLGQLMQTFDAVCSFQVLEHVINVKEFLIHVFRLVNDDGIVIFSTPNPDGVLKDSADLLELPPHHQLDISKAAYENIAAEYGFEIVDYKASELTFFEWLESMKAVNGFFIQNDDKYNILSYKNYLLEKNNMCGHTHLVVLKKKASQI